MKPILLLAACCLLFSPVMGQRLTISSKYCQCLEADANADAAKLNNCFEKILAAEFRKIRNEHEKLELAAIIESDLQKTCAAYVRLHDKRNPPRGDWEIIKMNPRSCLPKDACKQLASHRKLYYLEDNGDTTWVNLANGTWKETVGKKKHLSLLTFKPKNNGEFVLIFQGSTSPGINQNSAPGDQYKYRLVNKTPTYYIATTSHGSVVYQFKLYYN
ncbi:hypothetical protein I5M27_09190 [Adhaeribacter sp. BT258]|uniref:Uncharacterized protein n=1 Tax=Adhaeribacter terrigena TaxID=2793070 RepID=A0ABS1C3F1_9BACT|nr:hypothetical protein [Adhaeribacter terrigena]MBK0403158.1 hypothetical protein [Adhaeribacter terrigena]